MIPFNYHHLYYFYSVAKEGSISKAAKTLRLAQPTLSAQLKVFENYLERPLFSREGKRLILTDDGRQVLSYAKTIFDVGQEMIDNLGDRSGRKGSLKIQIGVSGFIPKTVVDALLRFILEASPETYLTVVEKEPSAMQEDLETHKLDMILNDLPYRAAPEEGIENFLLAKLPIVFCASRAMAAKYSKIPKSLHGAPLILPTAQSQTFHALQEYFMTQGVQPKVLAEIQDVEVARRLVLSGKGIAPLNEYSARHAPLHEKMVVLSPSLKIPVHDTIYLTRKKRRNPHPLVSLVLEKFRLA